MTRFRSRLRLQSVSGIGIESHSFHFCNAQILFKFKQEINIMGIGRKFTKTVITRPSKGGNAKLQRQRQHRERLVALGMSEAAVSKLNPKEVRDLLKYPAKTAAMFAAK